MTLVVIGVLNAQNAMTVTAALVTFVLYVAAFALVPPLGERVERRFEQSAAPAAAQRPGGCRWWRCCCC